MVIALVSHLRGPGSGHEWVRLVVGSLLCSERFFSEVSGFTLSSRINISKFQFDRMQDLPVNHFRVSGASWVNSNNSIQFKMAFEQVQESLGKIFCFRGVGGNRTGVFISVQCPGKSGRYNQGSSFFGKEVENIRD